MFWRVEINNKRGVFDGRSDDLKRAIGDLGLSTISSVGVTNVYNIEGDLSQGNIERIAAELLTDPITQDFKVSVANQAPESQSQKNIHSVEIAYNPGVTDPVEYSTL